MSAEPKKIPKQIRTAVHDALDLLERMNLGGAGQEITTEPASLPSLLEQCGQLAEMDPQHQQPVRIIHHLACTGGTVITKCLACSPNAHVLSEVDPLSPMNRSGNGFAPGDLQRLWQFSNRAPSQDECVEFFLAGLARLYEVDRSKGLRLILRDHAHSHFCMGPTVPERPSLREIVQERFPVRSVVTVRHPIDSYLSLRANGWLQFEPASLNEYAVRYQAFLDRHADSVIFRYEAFVASPREEMTRMCESLDLPFPDGFDQTFSAHRFSGDSGRRGDELKPRPRREMAESLLREIGESERFRSLCERLGYSVDS